MCYCTYEWEMCHRYDHILLYTHMKFVNVIKTKKIAEKIMHKNQQYENAVTVATHRQTCAIFRLVYLFKQQFYLV